MKLSALLTIVLLLFGAVSLTLFTPGEVEAARMGGGRSFGGKPFMSRPAPAPTMRQQAPNAQRQPMNQAQATAPRAGLFGGMGGLFGGLLAGTLLGSLLSGNGFSGGGLMDIILIGLLVFLGLKLFARFRSSRIPAPAGARGASPQMGALREDAQDQAPLRRDQTTGWDVLRDKSRDATSGGPQSFAADSGVNIPPDFDADEFLRGAKMAYNRLQRSWDRRDLDDIAQFATPAVLEAVREQLAAEPNPSTTEVLLVNAQLLGVETEGDQQRAEVFFDVLLRESPAQDAPSTVREIWHFLRLSSGGTWKLDGIQQVE